jgi:hypothetical protein
MHQISLATYVVLFGPMGLVLALSLLGWLRDRRGTR